jgi:hypothetical protein
MHWMIAIRSLLERAWQILAMRSKSLRFATE